MTFNALDASGKNIRKTQTLYDNHQMTTSQLDNISNARFILQILEVKLVQG